MSDMPPSRLALPAGGPDDGRPNNRIWTPEFEYELRDVLIKFPRMDDPTTRLLFLREVSARLGMGDQSFCEFDNDERIHIARIAQACGEYRSPLAALNAFVKAMEYFNGNTEAFELLKDCEDSLGGLTDLSAVRLHSVLKAIRRLYHPPDHVTVHRIAERVLNEDEISPLRGGEELLETIRRLNSHRLNPRKAPDSARIPLVVRFLYALTDELEDADTAILNAEVEQIMTEFRLQPATVALAVNSKAAPPAKTVFQIHIESESPPDQEKYRIWAHALDRSASPQKVIGQWPSPEQWQSAEEFAAHEIDGAGSRFLRDPGFSAALGAAEDVTVEFVLPDSLLGHPVEQWPVDISGYPIGKLCPVTVASLDRRNRPVFFRNWKTRWNMLFGADSGRPLGDRLGWLHDGDTAKPVPSKAFSSARYVEVTSTDRVINWLAAPLNRTTPMFGLTFAYNPDEMTAQLSIQSAITQGIPVLVWRRDNGDTDELENWLAGMNVHQLLEELYTGRQQATGLTDCRAHIVVLWDNPIDITHSLLTAPR